MSESDVVFPKWFSRYSEPRKPVEPKKAILRFVPVQIFDNRDVVHQIPQNVTHFEIELDRNNYGEDEVKVTFGTFSEIENPDYKNQMKYYKQALEDYEKTYPEWVRLVAVYDEMKAAEGKEIRRKTYEELRKEFEEC